MDVEAAASHDEFDDHDENEAAERHQLEQAGAMVEAHDCSESEELDPILHSGWMFVKDTDSEDDENELEPSASKDMKITRARVSEQREEYQELQKLGLVERPPGCAIGVHPSGQVWRARASEGTFHGRRFGGSSGRTPRQALLRVIELMLLDHLALSPKDRLAKGQLQRVREARSAELPHKD